jgi:hypothetical protein
MASKPMRCACGRLLGPGARGPATAAPETAAPSSGSLLDGAFDDLQPSQKAPPPLPTEDSSFGSFLDEALAGPLPAAEGPVNPFQSPGTTLPSPPQAPRYSTSPVFTEETYRPSRGAPGPVSRAIVGGFMTFIGGIGLIANVFFFAVSARALFASSSATASPIPGVSVGLIKFDTLLSLVLSVVALVAACFYLLGGVGILRGLAAGAEKGATASAMVLSVVAIRVVWAIIFIIVVVQKAGVPSSKAGAAIGGAIVGAMFVGLILSVMPAALFFWCTKYGPRMK